MCGIKRMYPSIKCICVVIRDAGAVVVPSLFSLSFIKPCNGRHFISQRIAGTDARTWPNALRGAVFGPPPPAVCWLGKGHRIVEGPTPNGGVVCRCPTRWQSQRLVHRGSHFTTTDPIGQFQVLEFESLLLFHPQAGVSESFLDPFTCDIAGEMFHPAVWLSPDHLAWWTVPTGRLVWGSVVYSTFNYIGSVIKVTHLNLFSRETW